MQDNKENNESIALIAQRIVILHEDITDLRSSMKESMAKVADAMYALVRIEERQSTMFSTHDKLQAELERSRQDSRSLESRVDALERGVPLQNTINKWVLATVAGGATLAATLVLKYIGLM